MRAVNCREAFAIRQTPPLEKAALFMARAVTLAEDTLLRTNGLPPVAATPP